MTKRSPLGELYDVVVRANGWTLRDVADRATTAGEQMSKSRVGQLVNAPTLTSITAGAIDGLAAGLNLSRDRVALAAIQSMGYRVADENMTPAEAIMRDETLSADTREALLSILRAAGGRRRGA